MSGERVDSLQFTVDSGTAAHDVPAKCVAEEGFGVYVQPNSGQPGYWARCCEGGLIFPSRMVAEQRAAELFRQSWVEFVAVNAIRVSVEVAG